MRDVRHEVSANPFQHPGFRDIEQDEYCPARSWLRIPSGFDHPQRGAWKLKLDFARTAFPCVSYEFGSSGDSEHIHEECPVHFVF